MGFGPALATILLRNSVAPNETGRDEQVPPFLFSLLAFGVAHQLRDCECFGRQVTYHTTVAVAAIFSGFVGRRARHRDRHHRFRSLGCDEQVVDQFVPKESTAESELGAGESFSERWRSSSGQTRKCISESARPALAETESR